MKNILCIANDIGYSAAGVVFETIVKEMQNKCNVHIISPQISDSVINTPNITILPTVEMYNLPWRISRLSATLLGLNIVDYLGSRQQQKNMKKVELPRYDCILSLIAQQKYFGLILGRDLARKLNTKWAVYSVDAIPVPNNWGLNSVMRYSMGRTFPKLIKDCDLFLLSNPQMLKYQIDLMPYFRGKFGVVYTPSRVSTKRTESNVIDTPVFLYTGGVYRLRRMDILMQAFRRFVSDEPRAKMIFVGSSDVKDFEPYKDLISSNNLEVHGYVNDLSVFYNCATVLLDLNADISNDVFLSSKIVNYLPINKPILCISGNNSPARKLFVDDESIVHSFYDEDNIYDAMRSTTSIKSISQNRGKYVEMFSAENVVRTLIKTIISE